jgi:hypothetical protein
LVTQFHSWNDNFLLFGHRFQLFSFCVVAMEVRQQREEVCREQGAGEGVCRELSPTLYVIEPWQGRLLVAAVRWLQKANTDAWSYLWISTDAWSYVTFWTAINSPFHFGQHFILSRNRYYEIIYLSLNWEKMY